MTHVSQQNPTGRFTGLEDLYARHRPGYPAEAIEFIVRRCALDATTLLVDIGCGTGISTRLFAERGIPVIGIEPNDAMRSKAESQTPADGRAPQYRDGTAEATGLENGCAAGVLAAQAFHWFQADASLREFHRVLRPGGHAVLMWNERDGTDPFTAAYGEVVRSTPGAAAVEVPRGRAGEAILHHALFANADKTIFGNAQQLDEAGLIGRSLSASYSPREPSAVADFTAALRNIFARYQHHGSVVLKYETSVYVGQRRDSATT